MLFCSFNEDLVSFPNVPCGTSGKKIPLASAENITDVNGAEPWVEKTPWRREGLSTPVFWPGEFHVLYNPWGQKE